MKALLQNKLKNIYLILLLLILNLFSSCKEEGVKINKIDYINYTKKINQAERFILDSAYTDALLTYNEALNNVDIPLADHCFTAMQVSAYLDSIQSFKHFTIEAIKSGLGQSQFNRDSLLKNYIKDKRLDSFIAENYNKYHPIYKSRIDYNLKDSLNILIQWDRKWKVYYLDSLMRNDPDNHKVYSLKYDSIVSLIVDDYLIPLIKKNGYPGERKIGYGINGFLDSYNYSYANARAKILLMHYYIQPKSCNYNDLFFEETIKGNMTPSEYATVMDFQARNGADVICDNFKIYDEHYIISDSTRFKEFNINRFKIGLESIRERSRKYKRGQHICKEIRKNKNYEHVKLFYWCG